MPQDLGELVELLELERLEVDLFRGQQPTTSLQRVFGGQVLAQALRAACYAAAEDRSVHSLHGYFLLGGDPSVPILYDVQRIRDGRSFSVLRVVARQHGRVIFYLTSSFHVRETGFEHQDVMPEVTAPEDCPSLAEVYSRAGDRSLEAWKSEWAALDVRYAGHSGPGGDLDGSTRPAKARLWLRAAGDLPDDPDLNACVLTYASDLTLLGASLVPHGVLITSKSVSATSLDHAMWFHRPVRADHWMLYDQASPSASGARGFSLGRVFNEDGDLVVSVAQEGLIRRAR
jgi:acyl-CoA thioesterase-2